TLLWRWITQSLLCPVSRCSILRLGIIVGHFHGEKHQKVLANTSIFVSRVNYSAYTQSTICFIEISGHYTRSLATTPCTKYGLRDLCPLEIINECVPVAV